MSEIEKLKEENERLRAEVAFIYKVEEDMPEKITGQDFEMIFCGLEGSYGEVIDVDAHFQSIGADGKSFTIKLSDEQFKKLKDLRIGSIVKVKLA